MSEDQSSPAAALAIVLLLAVVAGAAFATSVAATSHDDVTADDPVPGVATNHTWVTHYDGTTSNTTHNVTLDYSGSGTDLSAVTATDVSVDLNGTFVPADGVTVGASNEVLTIDVNDSMSAPISNGDRVMVSVVDDAVVNPSAAGDYGVSIDLNESGSTFHTASTTLRIEQYLDGYVTDESDTAIDGATVQASNTSTGGYAQTTTDASGYYNVTVPVADYTVQADASGYTSNTTEGVTVGSGSGTTHNATLTDAGEFAGQVTDADGNALDGAQVIVLQDYSFVDAVQTNATGHYSVEAAPGNYTVEADASGYVLDRSVGESVTVDATTTVDFALQDGGNVTGTVVNESDGTAVSNAFVMVEGDVTRFASTDSSGQYQITVPEGDYSVTAFSNNGGVANGSASVSVATGGSTTANLALVYPQITESSVSYASGTEPDMGNVSLETRLGAGMLLVQLVNDSSSAPQGMPNDLEGLGVDETTEFEINITVQEYDPSTLLWGARNVEWDATQNGSDAHDVTIRTQALHLAGLDDPNLPIGPLQNTEYEEIDWPTGSEDSADLGWNRTVYFGLFDMANVPDSFAGNVDGMTITTNAQTFSRPRLTDSGLEVYVAGPHTTLAGNTHDGYYDAFVPNAQLDAWDVDDPENELEALYKGQQSAITVTETDDGAWISLDITYSDGVVELSPNPSSDTGTDGGSADLQVTSVSTLDGEFAIDEGYAVDATVENAGDAGGSMLVDLTANGEGRASASVSVGAGESVTVTLDDAISTAGTYDLAVEGVDAGTIEVVEPSGDTDEDADAGTTDGETDDGTDEETDETTTDGDSAEDAAESTGGQSGSADGQPGFGIAVAVLALLGAAGLRLRREP